MNKIRELIERADGYNQTFNNNPALVCIVEALALLEERTRPKEQNENNKD